MEPAQAPFKTFAIDVAPSGIHESPESKSIWFFHRLGDSAAYIFPSAMANVFSVKKDAIAKVLRRGKMPKESVTHNERKALIDLGLLKTMQGAHTPSFLRFDLAGPLFKHFGCDLLWESVRDELERLKKENLLEREAPREDGTALTQSLLLLDLAKPRRQALAEHLLSSEATEELVGMKDFCCTENNSQRLKRAPLREKSWKHYRQCIMRFYGYVSRMHPRLGFKLNHFTREDLVTEYMDHLRVSVGARGEQPRKGKSGIHTIKAFLDAGIKAVQYAYRAKGPSYAGVPSYRILLDHASEMQRQINIDVGHKTKAHIANWIDYPELVEKYEEFCEKVEKKIRGKSGVTDRTAGLIRDVIAMGLCLKTCPGRSADSYEMCIDEAAAMATLDESGDPMGRWVAKDSDKSGAYRIHLERHKNSSKAFNGKIEKDLPFDFSYWVDLYLEKARPYLLGSGICPYLFFQPRTLTAYNEGTYFHFLSTRFSNICGKKLGPTLIRKIIITHFESKGPTTQERESRSIAMGHSVVTAKQIYSKLVPSSNTDLAVRGLHAVITEVRDKKRNASEASQGSQGDDTTDSEDEAGDPLHLKIPRLLDVGEIPGHEGYYTMKSILDENEKKYLIHWEGYSKEEATWEPKRNVLAAATQLITDFHERRAAERAVTILRSPAAAGMTEVEAMVVDDEFIVLQSATECS